MENVIQRCVEGAPRLSLHYSLASLPVHGDLWGTWTEVQTEVEGPTGRREAKSRHMQVCKTILLPTDPVFRVPELAAGEELREQQCRAGAEMGDSEAGCPASLPLPSSAPAALRKNRELCGLNLKQQTFIVS